MSIRDGAYQQVLGFVRVTGNVDPRQVFDALPEYVFSEEEAKEVLDELAKDLLVTVNEAGVYNTVA